jgi:RNA polymerase sporulation-specific sigma factor
MKAAKNYDSEIGTFSTYATRIINGEIKRYFRDNGDLVQFSRSCKEIESKMAMERIDKADITIEKIIEIVGCTERVASQALDYMAIKKVSSLDKPIASDEEDATLMDYIPSHENDVDFDILYKDFLLQLTENEKLSVELIMLINTNYQYLISVTIRIFKKSEIKLKIFQEENYACSRNCLMKTQN